MERRILSKSIYFIDHINLIIHHVDPAFSVKEFLH